VSDNATLLLMTPGPTRIPERVLRAGTRPLHHRTPEFSDVLAEMLDRLRPLYGTVDADILPIHGTGRAGLEAAVVNLFDPGDTVVACCNGKFGAMWADLAEIYGLRVIRVCTDWERTVDPAEVASALEGHPEARAVSVVHSETSTGALNPVSRVAEVARARGALVLVDAVSSLGGTPFRFDAWGVDVAVTSSQKCLMSSPGLTFVALSAAARVAVYRGSLPRAYLDLRSVLASLAGERPETPGTAPVMVVLQVLEALRVIDDEGPEAVFARHRDMASRVRGWAAARGLQLAGSGILERSPTLTALLLPDGVDATAVRVAMRNRGIDVATGRGTHRSSAVRIGHLGDIRVADVERTLATLDEVLGSDDLCRATPHGA
jgi:aspartate aminotransferase-like enzyme